MTCIDRIRKDSKRYIQLDQKIFENYEECVKSNERYNAYGKKVSENEKQRILLIDKLMKEREDFRSYYITAMEKNIKVGMPKELLILSWGYPRKINKYVVDGNMREQYVYLKHAVYLEQNRIISFHEQRRTTN